MTEIQKEIVHKKSPFRLLDINFLKNVKVYWKISKKERTEIVILFFRNFYRILFPRFTITIQNNFLHDAVKK